MMRTARLLTLLFCLILLTGCAGGSLLVPWPPMPTSVILSPTPRPTLVDRASTRLTATPLPTSEPVLGAQEVYAAALRPDGLAPVNTAGMTEYRLDVTVAPDLSEITGQADIRYTNREADAPGHDLSAPLSQPVGRRDDRDGGPGERQGGERDLSVG